MKPIGIYSKLLSSYGKQEWWPANNNFSPKQWEICVGAILTQNTSWKNVEKALQNLKRQKLISAGKIASSKIKVLEDALRPSGFYKQKAKRLKDFSLFASSNKDFYRNITREELLMQKGIGKETADSILLYACNKPFFVVDAYTKRIFSRLGMISTLDYEEIREFFEKNLPRDLYLYQEFHALIVEHAKRFCKKKPECARCPLEKVCKKKIE